MSGSRGLSVERIMEQLNGSPQYLGTIAVTTANSISNLSGAIRPGDRLLLIADAACYVLAGDSATVPSTVLTASNGVVLAASEKFYMTLSDGANTPGKYNTKDEAWVQAITASGTANLRVFRLV
jgi:hypothetical protein